MNTMKNIILIALMLTTLTSYATKLTTTSPGENVTTVEFTNVKKGHLLSIKDASDITLYSEQVASSGTYTQYFDLTSLDNGNYNIELNKDSEILIKSFQVQNSVVTFFSEETFFKPVAALRSNQLFVSQLTTSEETLEISIYYNNELIHEEQLSSNRVLNRIFQLSQDKKGDYVAIMKTGDRTFYKSFSI